MSSALAVSTSPCPVSSLPGCQLGCSCLVSARKPARARLFITRLLKRRLLRLADTIALPHHASGEQTHHRIDSLYSAPALPTAVLLCPPKQLGSHPRTPLQLPEYFPLASPLTHLCDTWQSEVAHSLPHHRLLTLQAGSKCHVHPFVQSTRLAAFSVP